MNFQIIKGFYGQKDKVFRASDISVSLWIFRCILLGMKKNNQYFFKAFDEQCKVLLVGAIGSDYVSDLNDLGYVTEELSTLADLSAVEDSTYSNILYSVSLGETSDEHCFEVAFSIRRVLNKGGHVFVTGIDTSVVFNDKIQLLFERLGFKYMGSYGQPVFMLFELGSFVGHRSIDTIESILNNDAKTATYKLALFRAFSDIATTNYKLAKWQNDSRVKIPIQIIAEKWLEYYWPIVESPKFIPQTTNRTIAFRRELELLIEEYQGRGGLSAFHMDYRSNNLTDKTRGILKNLFVKLRRVIKAGPIQYSGGGEPFNVFQYDKADKTVLMSVDMWRELSLMGSWIKESSILRWAELTSHISHNEIKPSEVIDCLLTSPIQERDVCTAKSFYNSLPSKECVWTGQRLTNKYDLDHVIPFSLWKNNDLWNLLPANSKVNGHKRDKLPDMHVLKLRKDCIVYYWELIKQQYPIRFEYEANQLIGVDTFNKSNWQNKLFINFTEAIEMTAIQRGIARWTPTI
jgi:hypothetical protein